MIILLIFPWLVIHRIGDERCRWCLQACILQHFCALDRSKQQSSGQALSRYSTFGPKTTLKDRFLRAWQASRNFSGWQTIRLQRKLFTLTNSIGPLQSSSAVRRRFSWSPVKRASSNKVNNKVDAFECDLYMRCPSASQLTVSHVFRDCVDRLRAIAKHANRSHWDQQTFGVLLAEVAQTLQSMRAKLWQLERALQFGPPELKSPTCCIACINGDAALFEDAVHAARKSLSQAITFLSAVPVYAIWTESRNTYAEIRAVKDELKELSAKSDRNEAAIKELSAKSDRNEAAIKELSAKSDRNEAAIKELCGKSDQLMEMMERIADRLGDPAQKDCNGHDCCCADSFNTLTVPNSTWT